MIETHYRSKRAHARVLIDKFGASFTAEEIANMNKAIAEADQYRASQGRELTDIKWEQVAERPRNGTLSLYQLFYRDLSSDGAHATIDALERFLVVDGGGQITDFKVRPTGADLSKC